MPERPTPEPTRPLAPGARGYWTVQALAWAVPLLVGVAVLASALEAIDELPGAVVPLLWALAVLAALGGVLVAPQLRWRRWRYEVRDEELDLRRGALTVTRTLVPIRRVQHVDTKRTVVSQLFNLASVVVHTAAGTNEIPALSEADAASIRDRIAELAGTADDPV